MSATRCSLPSEKPALCGVTMTLRTFHSGESSGNGSREHVEIRAGKPAVAQSIDQRRFVDNVTARNIDQAAVGGQQCQLVHANQAARFRCQCTREHQPVGRRQHFMQRGDLDVSHAGSDARGLSPHDNTVVQTPCSKRPIS